MEEKELSLIEVVLRSNHGKYKTELCVDTGIEAVKERYFTNPGWNFQRADIIAEVDGYKIRVYEPKTE